MTEIRLAIPQAALGRPLLIGAVAAAGLANGIATRILLSVNDNGWYSALISTFDISALCWIACFMLFQRLTAVDPAVPEAAVPEAAMPERATLSDLWAAGFCFLAFLIPVAQTTWLALTAFALYFAVVGRRDPRILDACWLLLGLSVPLFWGRTLLAVFSGPILNFEAAITAALVGTQPTDNAVPFIDGTGVLWVAPACSTVLCISHALLCAVMFKVGFGLSWSRRLVLATLGACLAVTLVNVIRLWALARFPAWYSTIHGPEGGAAFSYLILAVMVGVLALAVKYERPHSV